MEQALEWITEFGWEFLLGSLLVVGVLLLFIAIEGPHSSRSNADASSLSSADSERESSERENAKRAVRTPGGGRTATHREVGDGAETSTDDSDGD